MLTNLRDIGKMCIRDRNDTNWFEYKKRINLYEIPINIYEVNLPSWKRKENGDFYTCLLYTSRCV